MCCLCQALFAVFIGLMAVAFGVMYVLAGVPTARVLEGATPAALSSPLGALHCAWRLPPRPLVHCIVPGACMASRAWAPHLVTEHWDSRMLRGL